MNIRHTQLARVTVAMKVFKIPTKSTYFGKKPISSLEMFDKIIQHDNSLVTLTGFSIFTPRWTVWNPFAITLLVNFVIIFIVHIYDLYLFRDDAGRFFLLFLSLSAFVQSLAKLYTFIYKMDIILDQKKTVESFLKAFENNTKMNQIYEKWLLIVCHVMVSCMGVFIGIYMIGIFYPVAMYFVFGERILLFGFEIPFLDWNESIFAYLLNCFWQDYMTLLFMLGSTSSVFLCAYPVLMIFGQFEVLKTLINELEELILSNKRGENNGKIKSHLKKIIQMHNEVLK